MIGTVPKFKACFASIVERESDLYLNRFVPYSLIIVELLSGILTAHNFLISMF